MPVDDALFEGGGNFASAHGHGYGVKQAEKLGGAVIAQNANFQPGHVIGGFDEAFVVRYQPHSVVRRA